MSRRLFGWDLPPGVSQRMIDEAYGEGEECACDTKDAPCKQFNPDPMEPIEGYATLMKTSLHCSICGHELECHPEKEPDYETE